jgi:8-oxo-dGTP pyrophosphatase MutT (NUDIX family)
MIDVCQPDGTRFEHHAVDIPQVAAAAVLDRDRVLMLWRHRFITDTWSWELPAGVVDDGEDPRQAAERETLEETGVAARGLRDLVYVLPAPGISTAEHHVFWTYDFTVTEGNVDPNESSAIDWIPLGTALEKIDQRVINVGLTIAALLRLREIVKVSD